MLNLSGNSGTMPNIDTGPLSWVMTEIRAALTRSTSLLEQAASQDRATQQATLSQAGMILHQAHGALEMVDITGVTVVTVVAEDIIERLEKGTLEFSGEVVQALASASQAVIEYLEELLAGAPHQPVRLYPYYRDLQVARGFERAHPSDLFFPNLAIRPQLPLAHGLLIQDSGQLRQRYEKALLLFLKSSDKDEERANATIMCELIGEVERAQVESEARAFWWVMYGFASLVATGGLANEVYVKQLFARINLQMRRLGEGAVAPNERLLRDALFFIALSDSQLQQIQQLRDVYQLKGLVPPDFERRRYGQVDGEALALARDQLGLAKNLWSRIATGDSASIALFDQAMQTLADAGARLNSPALTKLLRELNGIARHAAHSNPGDSLGLEVAGSLLFIENALSHASRMADDFTQRAEALTGRLLALVAGKQPSQETQWLDELSRNRQQHETMQALSGEMQANLAQAEKMLDEYFGNPSRTEVLETIDPILHQIEGVMSIIDQEDAKRAVAHIRTMVQGFASGDPKLVTERNFRHVAGNIGALSFLIENLQTDAQDAGRRFYFDSERGIFHVRSLEKTPSIQEVQVEPLPPMASILEAAAAHMARTAQSINLDLDPALAAPAAEPVEEPTAAADQDGQALAPESAQDSVPEPLPQAPVSPLEMPLPEQVEEVSAVLPAAGLDEEESPDLLEPLESVSSLRPPEPLSLNLPESLELPASLDLPDVRALASALAHAAQVVTAAAEQEARERMIAAPDAQAEAAHALPADTVEAHDDVPADALDLSAMAPDSLAADEPAVTDIPAAADAPLEEDIPVAQESIADLAMQAEEEITALPVAEDESDEDWLRFLDPEPPVRESAAHAAAPIHAPAAQASASLPADDAAIDAELLEIFLMEAEEVLDTVQQAMADLQEHVRNLESMTMLRRSFHTLKGSGRMVGLAAFGDAAWSIEQVINRRLSEGEDMSPELAALLQQATDELALWVGDLQRDGHSARNGAALIAAATHVRDGTVAPAAVTSDFALESASPDQAQEHEEEQEQEQEQEQEPQAAAAPREYETEPAPRNGAVVIEFPDVHQPDARVDDSIKRIGDLEISVPLHNIYLAETDDLVRLLMQDMSEWRHEPGRAVNIYAVHAAHSLSGSSITVGFSALHEIAHALEMVLQTLARRPVALQGGEFDLLDHTVLCMKDMLRKFALCEMPEHDNQLLQALKSLRQSVNEKADGVVEIKTPLPGFAAAPSELSELSESSEPIAPDALEQPAGSVEAMEPEPPFFVPSGDAKIVPITAEIPRDAPIPSAASQEDAPQPEPAGAVATPLDSPEVVAARLPRDDLDVDLLPVFLEEGRDLLPQIGNLLRNWQQDPADSSPPHVLQRLLHTIKGSARMAGAMGLGQYMHEMESRIEHITRMGAPALDAIEELQGRLDMGLVMFDQLQNRQAHPSEPVPARQDSDIASAEVADSDSVQTDDMLLIPAVTPLVSAPGQAAATSAVPLAVPLIRVRADLLDRLVNQAGEVSISRSRVETEVSVLKQSLADLTENLMRMRGQLREIEIQAESQISAHAQSARREFDPLEFDRFTRLQELTRMMAETVNDVATVQQNLNRTVDQAEGDLAIQARLTREMQQDLMRVRMVQFASISERLYRVARQTSKELDKRVNLDIQGGSVEVDRSVLERMAGPFEHLLRNAIVHGVESRATRVAEGKSETGELLIEVRQSGNEVVLQFSDDGHGLDLARIRQHAHERGMLEDGQDMPEAELCELIFHPGFSTAREVTELAGRGIGMDVVRSEVLALGGRIGVDSKPGEGTRFTIHLPLTLAVTQVVLLTTGARTYAVPSVLVEQVQQQKTNALAAAYNDGAVMWQNRRVPLYYLSALLGDQDTVPVTQRYSPVVILRSGNDRVAIHVDEVLGNREVVVKNIGPQLARMPGIAGATVLGVGEIVLILDPLALALRLQQQAGTAAIDGAIQGDLGAVAEIGIAAARAEPVQGLRSQPVVMVVDDSLTVRRVTQRLLAREGYQVVLAKDGVDALEQLQEITPDVMLVDIEMPRMDGFDLTRNVRGDERTKDIPIIMITSRTATKHRNYALELGVNEYLGKPYQETELLTLITNFVGREEDVS